MKVSLISTLKNEESSIRVFLDSLLSQSRPPDEIIMVDGKTMKDSIVQEIMEGGFHDRKELL